MVTIFGRGGASSTNKSGLSRARRDRRDDRLFEDRIPRLTPEGVGTLMRSLTSYTIPKIFVHPTREESEGRGPAAACLPLSRVDRAIPPSRVEGVIEQVQTFVSFSFCLVLLFSFAWLVLWVFQHFENLPIFRGGVAGKINKVSRDFLSSSASTNKAHNVESGGWMGIQRV